MASIVRVGIAMPGSHPLASEAVWPWPPAEDGQAYSLFAESRREVVAIGATRLASVRKAAGTRNASEVPTVPQACHGSAAKLRRDRFTIPHHEHELLAALKRRAVALGHPLKKSQVVRAGIKALAAMSDNEFLAAAATMPATTSKRPKVDKQA